MALRRAGQSLAGRLLQGQVPAFSVAGVRAGPLFPQQEDEQSRTAASASSIPCRGVRAGALIRQMEQMLGEVSRSHRAVHTQALPPQPLT